MASNPSCKVPWIPASAGMTVWGCYDGYFRGTEVWGASPPLCDDVVGVALEEGDDVGYGAFVEELDAFGGLVGQVGC